MGVNEVMVSVGFRKVNGQKQAARLKTNLGRRLRKARAAKYGLTVPQFRSMGLRPGQKPLGWQVREARKV
jgi:hypothetical protein